MASCTLDFVLENTLELIAGEHFTREVAPHLNCDEADLIADLMILTHQHDSIFNLLNAHGASPTCREHFSLGNVRSDHVCERQQRRPKRVDRIRVEQAVASLRDHHGIHDDIPESPFLQRVRHGNDDVGCCQHADFDRMRADVFDDHVDLRHDEIDRDRLPCANPACVLRRDRRDRARAIHAVRGKRLEVRLNAGAAAGVAPRDCQCRTHTVKFADL